MTANPEKVAEIKAMTSCNEIVARIQAADSTEEIDRVLDGVRQGNLSDAEIVIIAGEEKKRRAVLAKDKVDG